MKNKITIVVTVIDDWKGKINILKIEQKLLSFVGYHYKGIFKLDPKFELHKLNIAQIMTT